MADQAPRSTELDVHLAKCNGFTGSLKFIIHSRELPNAVASEDSDEEDGGGSEFDEPANLSEAPALPRSQTQGSPEPGAPQLLKTARSASSAEAPRQFRPLPQPQAHGRQQPAQVPSSAQSQQQELGGTEGLRGLSAAEADSIRQLGGRIALLTSTLSERDREIAELSALLGESRNNESKAASESQRTLEQLELERKETTNLRQQNGAFQHFSLMFRLCVHIYMYIIIF